MAGETMSTVFEETTDRTSQRDNIRKQIALCEIRRERAKLLDAEFQKLTRELIELDERHRVLVQQSQAEIDRIEDELARRLSAGEPTDTSLATHRSELIETMLASQRELELRTADIDARRHTLRQQSDAIRREAGSPQALENQLAEQGIADDRLFNQHFATKQAVEWAQHRIEAARGKIKQFEQQIRSFKASGQRGSDLLLQRRVSRWTVELSAALDAMRVAREAEEISRRKMIDS
jgi:hypothetical protein